MSIVEFVTTERGNLTVQRGFTVTDKRGNLTVQRDLTVATECGNLTVQRGSTVLDMKTLNPFSDFSG